MSILLDSTTRVIVQGITGREGSFHTEQMQSLGTRVVGGTSPGKGGTTQLGVTVFNTVADAGEAAGANASGIFVTAPFAADATTEAAPAGSKRLECLTGGSDEERAAELLGRGTRLKAVAFISGRTAPEGKRMGHAGAIISGNRGTAKSKEEAFRQAGVAIAETTDDIVGLLQ